MKAGKGYSRRLLVWSVNYILGPFWPDCDLRRAGDRIAGNDGKSTRRKPRPRWHESWQRCSIIYGKPVMFISHSESKLGNQCTRHGSGATGKIRDRHVDRLTGTISSKSRQGLSQLV